MVTIYDKDFDIMYTVALVVTSDDIYIHGVFYESKKLKNEYRIFSKDVNSKNSAWIPSVYCEEYEDGKLKPLPVFKTEVEAQEFIIEHMTNIV